MGSVLDPLPGGRTWHRAARAALRMGGAFNPDHFRSESLMEKHKRRKGFSAFRNISTLL